MPATTPISVLFVEDSPHDAELALVTLERSGYGIDSEVVFDQAGVVEALQRRSFDLILSDFILPGYSGSLALQDARLLAPETPFIFLSGVFGEEHAVNMMRSGAVDYVLKQNLGFLPKAVERALSEVQERCGRLRAEEALREVEVRARLAIDAAGLGMWDYDPQHDRLVLDRRCRAMFGLADRAPVDIHVFESLCHPDDLQRMREHVWEAISIDKGDKEYTTDYRIMLESGQVRWFETRGQAFFDEGLCKRFIGVVMDVTEQRLATEALKRMNIALGERVEERTRERDRTWELSRDLLAVMRFDTTVIALNPAWEEALGWPREDLINTPLWSLVHADDLSATQAETERIRCGNVTDRFVNRMQHRDGSYRWLSWTAVPEAGMMYAAARDITSEIAAVDKLADANRELTEQIKERERIEATLQQMQRLEAVGQLTAGVAHDFNNLLTVILTSASFLKNDLERGAPLAKSLSRLQYIQDSGERGATLTSQLLAFARRQQLAPKAVDLNDTLVGLLSLLHSTLGGSVTIETDTRAGLWHALVDPTQIEMIILNLAINARDAMGSGGCLTLRTDNAVISAPAERAEEPGPGEYVVLSVKDTGSGMTDEVLQKAFEPFFTTKEVGKGSGLGLAQVFGFAKQSGGGARIETELGVGTTVRVYLPRVTAPERSLGLADHEQGTPIDEASHKVLLVDDDPAVREVTAQMLSNLGYAVVQADGGRSALELLEQGAAVDLVLADFAMPGMNGGELARAVSSRYPKLPVVFITGYAELGELGMGSSTIIQKPFREEQLVRKLSMVLKESYPA
ncbi:MULTISPECIES: hybrid sensor histidine kinase/response regulator [Stutzerimonas]|uniref:histidine kinase n=1 Tax=Stutzerimonas chloritidismutans TaxID=203192 RepID=A0ABU9M452_STUCH|nr:hybrid sensor histidine kinase/response regulator [Stutzerimonas xanthomarina]MBU0852843.1 response regulator [Gammaproteobacteria bacterium]HAW26418.1 hybrid sensor histidine kinase/response regulator [Pseudomonas sp.]MBK3849605.1 response regulator [Stutzerimonas xanthomarina]MBU1773902.1 response regulator [Gammaproteobacteria bacterium]MBU2282488.1 response regulator [Gammaproteobacteria bacterium]|tara:strand:- start:6114 stop:8516 length:2403 start_codon:yes stop_codon:yes gene_type:complete